MRLSSSSPRFLTMCRPPLSFPGTRNPSVTSNTLPSEQLTVFSFGTALTSLGHLIAEDVKYFADDMRFVFTSYECNSPLSFVKEKPEIHRKLLMRLTYPGLCTLISPTRSKLKCAYSPVCICSCLHISSSSNIHSSSRSARSNQCKISYLSKVFLILVVGLCI